MDILHTDTERARERAGERARERERFVCICMYARIPKCVIMLLAVLHFTYICICICIYTPAHIIYIYIYIYIYAQVLTVVLHVT